MTFKFLPLPETPEQFGENLKLMTDQLREARLNRHLARAVLDTRDAVTAKPNDKQEKQDGRRS